MGKPSWPIPKNNFFLQNTKNHLSVKSDSHKNKVWNGTDDNIASLLKVPSFSAPIVVFIAKFESRGAFLFNPNSRNFG